MYYVDIPLIYPWRHPQEYYGRFDRESAIFAR